MRNEYGMIKSYNNIHAIIIWYRTIALKTPLAFEKNECFIRFAYCTLKSLLRKQKTNNNSGTSGVVKQKFVKARQTRNFNYRL